jgi:hypothetical protein
MTHQVFLVATFNTDTAVANGLVANWLGAAEWLYVQELLAY